MVWKRLNTLIVNVRWRTWAHIENACRAHWALYSTTFTTLQCHIIFIALDHRESLQYYTSYILHFPLHTLRHSQWCNNVEKTKIGIHVSHTCHIILTAFQWVVLQPPANLHTNQNFLSCPNPFRFLDFSFLSLLPMSSSSFLDFGTLLL